MEIAVTNKRLIIIGIIGVAMILFGIFSLVFRQSENSDITAQLSGHTGVGANYRTFVTLQRYHLENNGDAVNPISNVRLVITFPNGQKIDLPEEGGWWPIGNGQVQEINRTFEIPSNLIQNDSFKMQIQMVRRGSDFLPCIFEISQLNDFNRSYICHTDIGWQVKENISEENLDKEGIQIRVFTDKNSRPIELPRDAIALRPM